MAKLVQFNQAKQEKKVVEMVSLDALLSGKVKVETSQPEIASSKGAIKGLTCNDNTYVLTFDGATDADGKPSIWQTDKSIMLCWASGKMTVTRQGKQIPVKVSVNISLA